MKLTMREQEICDEYSKRDADGKVHCCDCPLAINHELALCYATIDGRSRYARELTRYIYEYEVWKHEEREEDHLKGVL